jgi:hypothetical protein
MLVVGKNRENHKTRRLPLLIEVLGFQPTTNAPPS